MVWMLRISLRTRAPSTASRPSSPHPAGEPGTGERHPRARRRPPRPAARPGSRASSRAATQGLQRRRRADRVEVEIEHSVGRHVATVPRHDGVAVDQGADGLDREERDPLRPRHQGRRTSGRRPSTRPSTSAAIDRRRRAGRAGTSRRVDRRGRAVAPAARAARGRARGCPHRAVAQQVVEEVEQALVGVLRVVDHEHERRSPAPQATRSKNVVHAANRSSRVKAAV